MLADYKPFVDRVIQRYEGGYGWDKADPGGPTKYGITCYDLAEYRRQPMTSMTTWAPLVRDMLLSEAEAIYQTKYATGIGFNALPAGIDACMFDYAVNSGVARPIRVACALFKLPTATRMTADLFAALKNCDSHWFITAMCEERLHFMEGIRGGSAWATFGKGWGSRVADVRSYSDNLVSRAPAPVAPDVTAQPKAKATHSDAHAGSSATATAGSATVAAGAANMLGLPFWVAAVGFAVFVGVAVFMYYRIKSNAAIANATVVLPPNVTPKSA